MTGRIYSQRDDGTLDPMDETPYETEKLLQELLETSPQILAGEQITPAVPRRWVLISREMPVPDEEDATGKWWLDHLFLDQDAVPTLVEVKRSTNKEVRRKVVGQMLDYAANAVVYWPVETIRARFEAAHDDPAGILALALHPDSDDFDVEAFWKQLQANLRAGRLRLIFVADEIPRELQRIVEFLNDQMERAEVLALEVKRYKSEGRTTLVPRIIGLKDKVPGGGTDAWNEQKFFQSLSEIASPTAQDVVKRLYEWAMSNFSDISWGSAKVGKFFGRVKHNGSVSPMAVWHTGRVVVRFARLKNKAPFTELELRKQFSDRLTQIDGLDIPDDKLDGFVSIDPAKLADPKSFESFTNAFEWVINKIRES